MNGNLITDDIRTYAKCLRLSNFAQNCSDYFHKAQIDKPTYQDFILNVLKTELYKITVVQSERPRWRNAKKESSNGASRKRNFRGPATSTPSTSTTAPVLRGCSWGNCVSWPGLTRCTTSS